MKKYMKSLSNAMFLFVGAMLMFGINANAYIDPSVMTYMIQLNMLFKIEPSKTQQISNQNNCKIILKDTKKKI